VHGGDGEPWDAGDFSGDSLVWISVRDVDGCKMMSDYMVEMVNDGIQEFFVEFWGPNEVRGSDTQS
jgi:hypothetical protein